MAETRWLQTPIFRLKAASAGLGGCWRCRISGTLKPHRHSLNQNLQFSKIPKTGSQPWLRTGITCGALRVPMPGATRDAILGKACTAPVILMCSRRLSGVPKRGGSSRFRGQAERLGPAPGIPHPVVQTWGGELAASQRFRTDFTLQLAMGLIKT